MLARLVAAGALAAAAAACMTGSSNPGLMPVPGTPTPKTEIFTGTVAAGSQSLFSFNVTNVGDLSVTLSAAGPPSDVVMRIGLGLGTINLCNFQILKDTAAGDTPQIAASQVPSAIYCVGIGDIGNATGPVAFTLTVVHT
jgi:hypothetical protein